MSFRRRLMMAQRSGSEPPIPYQRVEYLKSSGAQYIDTGIIVTYPKLIDGMIIEIRMAANANAASGKNNRPYFFVGRSNNYAYYGCGYKYERSSTIFSNDTPYTLKLDSAESKFYVDGNIAAEFTIITEENTSGNNIALFGVYNQASMGSKYAQTIYWCKISYNGELVRDFVPCRIGTVGYMYDRVSGELFANLGTGDFTLGNDVN